MKGAAQITLDTLLAPSRLTRVYLQHHQSAALPGLDDLLDKVIRTVVDGRTTAVGRRVAHRTIMEMARTSHDAATSIDVSAVLDGHLAAIADRFSAMKGSGEDATWSRGIATMLRDGESMDRALKKDVQSMPTIPPGMPI